MAAADVLVSLTINFCCAVYRLHKKEHLPDSSYNDSRQLEWIVHLTWRPYVTLQPPYLTVGDRFAEAKL